VVVSDREQMETLLDVLGLQVARKQYVPEYQADCVFTEGPGASVEFVVPRGGRLVGFNKGAGGLHHIALEVDDLGAVSDTLREKEMQLLEPEPVEAGELRVNFLPPAYTRGLIVEFVEQRAGSEHSGEDETHARRSD
jgi:hypothetical protein